MQFVTKQKNMRANFAKMRKLYLAFLEEGSEYLFIINNTGQISLRHKMEKGFGDIIPLDIGSLVTGTILKVSPIGILQEKNIEEEIIVKDKLIKVKVSKQIKNIEKKQDQFQLIEDKLEVLQPYLTTYIEWAPEEEQKLYELYAQKGSKWVEIAKSFPSRQPNYIKNKFYGAVRKLVRKLNNFGKKKMRMKNSLKEISVVRPLQFSLDKFESLFGEHATLVELKEKILSALRADASLNLEKDGVFLIQKINKFNLETRSYYAKKKLPKISNVYLNRKKMPGELLIVENVGENKNQYEVIDSFSFGIQELSLPDKEEENVSFEEVKARVEEGFDFIDYTFFELAKRNQQEDDFWSDHELEENCKYIS